MSRKNIENIYSLSPMQQGILFHTLYDGAPGAYLVSLAWTLRGRLDHEAFARAWQQVVDRHTVLRTAFVWERLEKPIQVVRKRVEIKIEEVDLRGLPADEKRARAAAIQEELGKRAYDLTRAPLMRLALLQLEDDVHRFAFCSHHLLLDGWSLPVVVREAFTLYEAFQKGAEIKLDRPRPYGDYIAWLGKQDLGKAEAYWRNELQGFLAPTPFRVERLDQNAEDGFEERIAHIGVAEASALQGFAREKRITISTLVLGAWALLLARYSGEEEIVYGSTVSGRSAPVAGIDKMVGLFINTLPVRVRVPEGIGALAWLEGLQSHQAELREYEYSPLIQVQGWSELPRGVPLFESQVAFENYPSAETLLQGGGGLRVEETVMASQAHYPLTFNAASQRTIGLRISYDKRRFERATIDRMLTHLATLLSSIAKYPEKSVWELPILPEEERKTLLFGWNENPPKGPLDTTVHQLFERRADADPGALAVVARDGKLTFGELESRANRLANHLVKLGVGPDSVVALSMDRTTEMIIGILGILKAGGAYVPIDPGYPAARFAQIREEAGARVVVTRAALAAASGGARDGGVIVVEVDGASQSTLAGESDARPVAGAGAGPSNLAYVLFTSGSTGKPKGVAIEHRNLVNYVWGIAPRLESAGLGPRSTYAHISTFSADLGNTVLFPPLCLGGAIHVIPEELTTDADGIGAYFEREGIDCLKIVPSHMAALLSAARPERVIPKKLLVMGGEGAGATLVERVARLAPEARILNHYGPTETTVGVLTYPLVGDKPPPGAAILPLGRPLAGSRIYVLDKHMSPTPIGVPGEIFIGGAGVARGYLGREDLTAERFLPDPFVPGERVYRSGDRGRMLADGTILFLGRVDFQVKIRGYRIELGEIEAALQTHVGIREAVVLAVEGPNGDKHLAAYVVPRPMEGPSIPEMRAYLEARLPDYMVPASFNLLTAIPLNANGKIDRKALLAIDVERQEHQEEEDTFVAARSPIEEVLSGIWCDVFEKERIGVHDKFAELGGHSLLAIQIIARTREAFQVDIPLRAIFEAPTIAGLAREVEAAMAEAEGTAAPPIEPVARGGDLALSFAQERLWFLHQLEPDSPFYNVPSTLRMTGNLDVAALEKALGSIVARHEVLRTTFRAEGGKPVQVTHPFTGFSLPVERLVDLDAEARREAVKRETADESRRPFDLSTGPLLRAKLLVVSEEEHVLLLTLHHIVSDGQTRGILNRELSHFYRAAVAGREPGLAPLSIQYADYAAWQRKWLSGEVLDKQIAYWKKQLADAPHAIELPTDRPRPPAQTYRGSNRLEILPTEVGKALKELARREGVTLYMVLLSALDLLLHRWTGQREVVVGTSVSNRSRAETEKLVGFFINALVLATKVDDDIPFTELLTRVRDVCLGAYAHQDMPFERLVQELSPEPDPSRAPLFQVIFTMQNAPGEAMELPGLELEGGRSDVATVKYDLTFLMGEGRRGELGVSIDYNVDLFDRSTIDRMIVHLTTILTSIAKDASRKVSEIPMLPEGERTTLLGAWNDTEGGYSTDDCLHDLVEAQCDETPGAIAVASGPARVTYRELDERANRLARHLRARGVGVESVVGLYLGRSVEVVIAILGILKAGAAYVPLDPSYPPARVASLVEEAGARVVVTEDRLSGSLPVSGVTVVSVDGHAAEIAKEDAARVESGASSQNLAYVLFTSGSTGKPKGVAVEHRNLVNYVRGAASRLRLPKGATYAHVSTFSADLGNTVLFPPLCSGGAVHVVPEELTTSPGGLGDYFEEHGIDCLKIVPSHLSALLSGARPERVLPRLLLVTGGEGLSWDLVARVERLSPSLRIMNHYGPTETTIGVLTHEVPRGERLPTATVPLGRPLPNSRIYILDATLSPSPIGVPGEVYVGGAGVTRGYLGRPDLTEERFVPDPFAGAGARMYKSGDRAKYLPNGDILFLGRVDFQVKIRGYRIELGEIESALQSHVGIKDAVCLALDDGHGQKRLVAYVVPRPMEGPSPAEAQSYLERRLPEYMVPSAFVVLERLPLTPNGKIDRKALADLGALRALHDDGGALALPRTPVEEVLESIWCDVFEREQIGIHERFNDLGGHSLLAIQIVARARDAFSADLPLRAIFESPTIAGLAERVEEALREGAGEAPPEPITRIARDGRLPLSFAEERLWFLAALEPESAAYNIPLRLRLTGSLDAAALTGAIREIVRRHEVLRTTFETRDGAPVAVIHDDLDLSIPTLDVASEQAILDAARAEMEAPFDLARGPLVRGRLLRLGPQDHALLLTMHHIVSDAWTKGVINRELTALYEALRAGRPSPLPELTIQYVDFAAWQRRQLSGAALSRQLDYWRSALAGAPRAIELPTDKPRPAVLGSRGGRRRFSLPPSIGRAMKELARREGATLFMTLLAAFDVLLHRYTGQDDIVVGTPIAGRTRPEIEPLIGFFVGTLAIRAKGFEQASFVELLAKVREACLGAYAHQDLPFERLVQDLAPERDLARTPIFQVMFTLQGVGEGALTLPSLSLSGIAVDTSTSKFDLQLSLGDSPSGLLGAIEYNADLFEPETIDRMIEHYGTLLGSIAASPEGPIADLPIMTAEERRKVLTEWNDTAYPHPTDKLIHELFEARASEEASRVALRFEGESVTYRALDERANRLARALEKRGVGRGSLVGVCASRSIEMMVAFYAVLKAGGAYVPLDPEYPRERLAFMLEDCKPRVILTQAHLTAVLPDHTASVIRLDADWESIEREPAESLGRGAVGLDDLAYVIYTSGSTGRPKGAMNAHRGILNRLLWMQRAYSLTPEDVVIQKTPVSFDVSVWELFWPLMFGARLVVASPGAHKDPRALADVIQAEGVTTIHFVPSMLEAFVAEPRARACQSLRRVITSGEALGPHLAERFFDLGLGARLENLYGPTECAVDVTAYSVERGAAIIPIGRPIDNVRVYVLDPRGAPQPIGVPGEIFLAGVQVGLGYLNRDELTQERFLEDPITGAEVGEPHYKMYKTGDVGRWLPSGAVEYRGRTDFQVKIRGFRIELGEIEARIREHAEIRDVVVIAREGAAGDKTLAAYLVPKGEAPTVADLRSFLKDRLPEHMIPSAFVALPALPLTASGKVDRRALPAPEASDRLDLGEAFILPQRGLEEELARIWASVLRVPKVGAHDNFFALGGDSILSIQIVSRAAAAGIHVTPRQLFQHQTVAELAAAAGAARVAIAEQGPVTGPLPLTPVQRWRLEIEQPELSHDNQSYFLEADEPLDPAAFEAALTIVTNHHDALRLRLSRGAAGWEPRLEEPGQRAVVAREEIGNLTRAAAEAQAGLDVVRGPVIRAVVFESPAGARGKALIVAHHLAVDAVSWRVITEDLWSAYTALRRGESPRLPAKTSSYKAWAERLAAHADSDEVAREGAYWLGAAGESAALPKDLDAGENTEASARSVVISLSPEATEKLLREVPLAYRTQINDALLAALAGALGCFAQGPSVVVDLEGHGREDVFSDLDITRTVGWFTSVYPVRLARPEGGPGEALRATKEALRAVPNKGLGYGLLRYLRRDDIASRLAAAPGAEVSFNYLGQLDRQTGEGAEYRRASDPAGPAHGPQNLRRYLLDVHASVLGERLHVRFTYSENKHHRATIERLAGDFSASLQAIIEHASAPDAGGYTPSDFARAKLSQASIDALAARYGRRAIRDVHPLSPMQQGILFHALYAADPASYFVELAWTIEGDLDVSAFERAFQEVVNRHDALRTAVVWEGVESPVAVVVERASLPFLARDLRALSDADRQAEIDRFSADERRRGFDLAAAPLTRIGLLRLTDTSWRFVWASHHIVVDGWSMPILLREALAIYEGQTLDRPPLYSAYVAHLAAVDPEKREAFWRAHLAGVTAPSSLPGLPGAGAQAGDARFDERRLRLGDAESAALSAFARRHKLTMSTLVQGAFALLLARYSGERDIVFGSTVSGRSAPVPGIDRMVGLFINTLAVRASVDPEAPVSAFLARLQDEEVEMRQYEESPLAEVTALSAVPRGTPLFEAIVVFENQPVEEALKNGSSKLSFTAARSFERPPYPLTLQSSFRRSLLLRLGFDARRFDAAMIERMLGHLTVLLGAIARAPEAKIGTLPLMPEAERHTVLAGWNDTAFDHPTDRLIHEIFEAQVDEAPDAIAVTFEGRHITYRDLDERANRLAHALIRRGLGPSSLVGVAMDRSIEMMVALYGVLKAGGAYVPLDPEYPKDRLAFMLEDAAPKVILTQAHLASALPDHASSLIRLDTEWAAIEVEPKERPGRRSLGLHDLAYVIYTSGSTGRPKGAMNAHRGILNRLLWMQHAYSLTAEDVVLQKTPFSFDVSVWELFWPLMFGARLVVAAPGGHKDPAYLVETIAREGVTTMHFVPSMLAVFLSSAGVSRAASLTRVFASGEALPPALVDRFFEKLPSSRLVNLYGPTEAAVDVTSFECKPGLPIIPIGKPIHNTRMYVLDERMEPVPEGIRGELYIGGVQVGKGYLKRPELTAERFVADPFSGEAGAKLYKTGDVARLLPGGEIEYLGRTDFQVKLRGFRIELGEIEADLAGHPHVREAVVALRGERLIAYLVCREGPKPTTPELRSYLGERLPEHMIPSAFVLLDALPQTASGKVDRKALPAPEEGERAASGAVFAAAATEVEEALTRIWASVLRLPKVGIDDHFFEIGGDSILSIQIVSRALAAGIHLTPRQIFEHPTIRDLATVAGTRAAVSAEQGPVTGPAPLTPIEHWWLETPRADAHHWNQSVLVEIREPVDAAAMERAALAIFTHHDALRLRLTQVEGAYRQALSEPGEAPFRVVPRREMEAAIEATQSTFDLERGPVARVLLGLGDGEGGEPSRLLFAAHHLAVDGVSWRILLEDLWAAYVQAKRGNEIALPPKTTSWKHWAERLAAHGKDPAVESEASYWLARPEGVSARLPVEISRGDNDEGSQRSVVVSFSVEETSRLLREANDAYKTQIGDLLTAALAQAIAAWTGARGALFDVEGHGRDQALAGVDLTRTVGWLTTVYPLAIELPEGLGLGATLKSVKEQIRAVPNKGLGHGLLRYLREGDSVSRRLRDMAPPEILWNYLGQTQEPLADDAPVRFAEGSQGPLRSRRGARRYLLDVNARVVGKRLHVWFGYSENRHARGTIEALSARFAEALRALVDHCLSGEARGHTPSDFADANLSQDVIDMLVNVVAEDLSE